MGLNNILEQIRVKSVEQSLQIIGIDGCGGAGKSTIADKIKSKFSTVTVVHMDDFYLPSAQIVNEHPTNKSIGADFVRSD
ncbi:hypothetical protein ICS_02884 [Bacillus cereus BAG2O-3]|nr:hypothetical protein ICS_02884 [Bacillus cereus BAG2O-3]